MKSLLSILSRMAVQLLAAEKAAADGLRRRWTRPRGRGRIRAAETMTRQRMHHELRKRWYATLAANEMPRAERRSLARAYAAGEFRRRLVRPEAEAKAA